MAISITSVDSVQRNGQLVMTDKLIAMDNCTNPAKSPTDLNTLHNSLFHCINYCDDLVGADASKEIADLSFIKLGELLPELGLDESIYKARAPGTAMVYLGVQFNSVTMTMSVPPEKLALVKEEIEKWYIKSTAAKKPFQYIVGNHFWVSMVVQHSQTFMGRLLAQLRDMSRNPDSKKVKLSAECRNDLLWWRNFLKEYNGLTMIENDEVIKLTLPQLLDTPYAICMGNATLSGWGA